MHTAWTGSIRGYLTPKWRKIRTVIKSTRASSELAQRAKCLWCKETARFGRERDILGYVLVEYFTTHGYSNPNAPVDVRGCEKGRAQYILMMSFERNRKWTRCRPNGNAAPFDCSRVQYLTTTVTGLLPIMAEGYAASTQIQGYTRVQEACEFSIWDDPTLRSIIAPYLPLTVCTWLLCIVSAHCKTERWLFDNCLEPRSAHHYVDSHCYEGKKQHDKK